MSVEFRIGGRVVLVDPHPEWVNFESYDFPEKDSVYTIRAFHETPVGLSLLLEEISNSGLPSRYGSETGFLARRFRPVRETSIDCFTALLAKPPVRLREDA